MSASTLRRLRRSGGRPSVSHRVGDGARSDIGGLLRAESRRGRSGPGRRRRGWRCARRSGPRRARCGVDLVEQRAHCGGAAVGGDAEREPVGVALHRPARRGARATVVEGGRVGERRGPGAARRRCRLSSAGVPSATTRPPSITAMRSASWSASSRYWVVRKTVTPAADEPGDDLPHRLPAARVEAGGRLVEEDHLGLADQARGEVEAAAHAAGVGARRAGGRRRRGRTARAARAARPRAAARPGRRSRAIMRRFSSPVCSSSTAAYWPVRLIARRTAAPVATTSKPATRAWPPSGARQRGQDPHGRGLARAVRARAARTRVPRAARRSTPVRTVDRAVGLLEAGRLDRLVDRSPSAPLPYLLRMPYALLRKVYTVPRMAVNRATGAQAWIEQTPTHRPAGEHRGRLGPARTPGQGAQARAEPRAGSSRPASRSPRRTASARCR